MNILVTGGTGTFGHALLPQALASHKYARIAILSRDEDKQHRLRGELGDDPRLRWFIGDVRDRDRLLLAFRGVDAVVHAAALKHVISGEYNPGEHILTNVMGAMNVVRAAIDCGVKKVLAISTDKAVEPINLYGATKLCMERLFMSANALSPGATSFSCVRYGNVIGSRGSFIETLKRLKAEGATSFPLRDPESTRFWMEADAAAKFVLDRLSAMRGGEIFVPKLQSSSALAFARQFLPDATPEIVGVPRGEKIHETLVSYDEWRYAHDEGPYIVVRPNGPRKQNATGCYRSDVNPFQEPGDAEDAGRAGRGSEEVEGREALPDGGDVLGNLREACV